MVVPGVPQTGAEGDGPAEALVRFLLAAQHREHVRACHVGLRQVGIELQRLLAGSERLGA